MTHHHTVSTKEKILTNVISCNNCGATTPSGKFCMSCGERLPAGVPGVRKRMRCAECGAVVPGANFCARCGRKLEGAPLEDLAPAPRGTAETTPGDTYRQGHGVVNVRQPQGTQVLGVAATAALQSNPVQAMPAPGDPCSVAAVVADEPEDRQSDRLGDPVHSRIDPPQQVDLTLSGDPQQADQGTTASSTSATNPAAPRSKMRSGAADPPPGERTTMSPRRTRPPSTPSSGILLSPVPGVGTGERRPPSDPRIKRVVVTAALVATIPVGFLVFASPGRPSGSYSAASSGQQMGGSYSGASSAQRRGGDTSSGSKAVSIVAEFFGDRALVTATLVCGDVVKSETYSGLTFYLRSSCKLGPGDSVTAAATAMNSRAALGCRLYVNGVPQPTLGMTGSKTACSYIHRG